MRSALLILLTAAMLIALPAAGRTAGRTPAAPEPWATVNVCDTLAHPNEIGIRGNMPGLTRWTRMYMRFRVQYRTSAGKWQLVERGADSGWSPVATGRRGEHDSGWTFEFKPPAAGGAHLLRGVVSFQWRRRHRVVQRDRRFTEEDHPGTAGADPADFSAKLCAIA